MNKSKVLVSFVVLFCFLFMGFHFNENYRMADITRALIVPTITLLYLVGKKNKPFYFTLFLVAFSISDLITIFSFNLAFYLEYYLGNSLYIMSYAALTYHIILSINLKHIFTHFKTHVFVLFILNIYINFVLFNIEKDYVFGLEFSIELVYNICTILLLSVSLLNNFYRDDKKAFVLFLGTLCIVVSEVIQIAYYYIPEVEDDNILSIAFSLLLILAFYFYYFQTKLEYEEVLVVA